MFFPIGGFEPKEDCPNNGLGGIKEKECCRNPAGISKSYNPKLGCPFFGKLWDLVKW